MIPSHSFFFLLVEAVVHWDIENLEEKHHIEMHTETRR